MTAGGVAFFLRLIYLSIVQPKKLLVGTVLDEYEENDVVQAAKCFEAEKMASALLYRAEQSEQDLIRKLIKKGEDREAIKKALDYLTETGALSDARYAKAYLNSRRTRNEGRIKKAANMAAHGIDRNISKAALNDFFDEHSEEDMCRNALQKGLKQGKDAYHLSQSLVRKGFTANMVRRLMLELVK